LERDTVAEMHAVQAIKNRKLIVPRVERIRQLLRIQHLNSEEKQAIKRICEDYQNVFHLEAEPLTNTATVAHEINTRADTAPERETISSSRKT